jgi:peptidoglycan-associated lipoprotein
VRYSRALAAIVAVTALIGCHRGTKEKPTPPSPRPAAPATPPPAPPPSQPRETAPIEDEYARMRKLDIDSINNLGLLQEIHFAYDKADILDADRSSLSKNADNLKKFDFLSVTIEGHCDDRGTVEYNLALGERRAKAAYDYLVSLGVPAARLKTVSYGKEIPLCRESNEDCWGRNRRDHFTVTGKAR